MQEEQIFVLEHFLQGFEHSIQVLLEVKSNPSLQLVHVISEPEHVLQFESHLKH